MIHNSIGADILITEETDVTTTMAGPILVAIILVLDDKDSCSLDSVVVVLLSTELASH